MTTPVRSYICNTDPNFPLYLKTSCTTNLKRSPCVFVYNWLRSPIIYHQFVLIMKTVLNATGSSTHSPIIKTVDN